MIPFLARKQLQIFVKIMQHKDYAKLARDNAKQK